MPGAAVGVGRVIDVVQRTHGRDRHLGRPVHPRHRRLLEIACRPADQRRRHRCAAADEHLEVRQPGVRPLGGAEQSVEKRRGPRHVRAAFRQHQRHRLVGVPALHQHRRGAQQQRAFERVDRSADVRDRRRDEERVAVGRPASARRSDGSARGSNCACAEHLSAGPWCPRCRGSCARCRDSAPAAPLPSASRSNSDGVRRVAAGVAAHDHDFAAAWPCAAVTRSSMAA